MYRYSTISSVFRPCTLCAPALRAPVFLVSLTCMPPRPFQRLCYSLQRKSTNSKRLTVLPIGRKFGRISQKGLNKKWSGRTILADFEHKGPKKGPNFNKIVSLLWFSLILGKCPRNIVIFQLTQTITVFSLTQIPSKRENYWDWIFFLSGRIFLLDWPKSSAKSWHHWRLISLVICEGGSESCAYKWRWLCRCAPGWRGSRSASSPCSPPSVTSK